MAVSLASIVTRICSRVGLTDTDVTDLEDRYVHGYSIGRVMSVANALEPLRQVGFFDIVESGTTLKFVTRGKPVVRTLVDDDLGAFDVTGGDGKPPPAVSTRKMQDVELPRQLRLHFRNPDRDYEDDEQLSPSRVSTRAKNDVDVELAISITAEQAAQVAEVLWADPWAGRWLHQTSVDHSHIDLEPGDCLYLPVDDRIERVRIISIDDAAGLIRKLETVRDDDGSYSSIQAVDDVARTPSVVTVESSTELTPMDLPALRTSDTDAGFYVAARDMGDGNSWRGATIYRSLNDGGSFDVFATIANEATIGTVVNALPVGDLPLGSPVDWDDANTLTVELVSGSFESRTENEVLAGANHIAIGADTRWEIIGFTTATQISETQWQLTHLLRGRRTTEYVMGTSQAGDKAVLVSGTGVVRIPMDSSLIDEPILYRAVSIGKTFNDGDDITYIGKGRSLLPCAQSNLNITRQANGDFTLTWTRRDRLGQELVFYGTEPESDAPKSYDVEIYGPGSPSFIARSFTGLLTESATYTLAQQTSDWGSPSPSQLTFNVYKNSTLMGRGIVASSTVTIL